MSLLIYGVPCPDSPMSWQGPNATSDVEPEGQHLHGHIGRQHQHEKVHPLLPTPTGTSQSL